MLEIVLNLTVVVPAGFIALAVVFIGRRKPPNQREIDISLRFSREVAPPPAARGGAGPIFSFCAGRGRTETPISGHLLHRGQKLVDQAEPTSCLRTYREQESLGMLPLYATRIEDLGLGDFVKVDAQKMPARDEQIGQCAGDEQAMGVLLEAAIAHLAKPNTRLMTPIVFVCSILARTLDLVRFFARSISSTTPRWW